MYRTPIRRIARTMLHLSLIVTLGISVAVAAAARNSQAVRAGTPDCSDLQSQIYATTHDAGPVQGQVTNLQGDVRKLSDDLQSAVSQLQSQGNDATLDHDQQLTLQMEMTQVQQEWSTVASALQSLNGEYQGLASPIAAAENPAASGAASNFSQLISGLGQSVDQIQQGLQQIQDNMSGDISLGMMFQLQFAMQTMSQYIQSVSNVLTAINQELVAVALNAGAVRGGASTSSPFCRAA